MLAKFPDALLEEWAPVFFVPLVARLVNDPSPATRATVGATLAALLQARVRMHNASITHCLMGV